MVCPSFIDGPDGIRDVVMPLASDISIEPYPLDVPGDRPPEERPVAPYSKPTGSPYEGDLS